MGKTRDTEGTNVLKDRNGIELTEARDIKKRR